MRNDTHTHDGDDSVLSCCRNYCMLHVIISVALTCGGVQMSPSLIDKWHSRSGVIRHEYRRLGTEVTPHERRQCHAVGDAEQSVRTWLFVVSRQTLHIWMKRHEVGSNSDWIRVQITRACQHSHCVPKRWLAVAVRVVFERYCAS